MVETLTLLARSVWENDQYIARVRGLPLEAVGGSKEEAEAELVNAMRIWIELQDTASSLEHTLAEAGYPGVDEKTELQLEFVD